MCSYRLAVFSLGLIGALCSSGGTLPACAFQGSRNTQDDDSATQVECVSGAVLISVSEEQQKDLANYRIELTPEFPNATCKEIYPRNCFVYGWDASDPLPLRQEITLPYSHLLDYRDIPSLELRETKCKISVRKITLAGTVTLEEKELECALYRPSVSGGLPSVRQLIDTKQSFMGWLKLPCVAKELNNDLDLIDSIFELRVTDGEKGRVLSSLSDAAYREYMLDRIGQTDLNTMLLLSRGFVPWHEDFCEPLHRAFEQNVVLRSWQDLIFIAQCLNKYGATQRSRLTASLGVEPGDDIPTGTRAVLRLVADARFEYLLIEDLQDESFSAYTGYGVEDSQVCVAAARSLASLNRLQVDNRGTIFNPLNAKHLSGYQGNLVNQMRAWVKKNRRQ